jgi:Zn-dependent alcohol dehydrogenase
MKIKAAVVHQANVLKVEELELAPPKEHEILVKTAYTGFCHTDLHSVQGHLGFPFPLVLGHEAAGIVEQIGPGVTRFTKGDHVVPAFVNPCGQCEPCREGHPGVCQRTWGVVGQGTLLDGTSRLADSRGKTYYHHLLSSGFSSYMILPEFGTVKVRKDLPLDQACFFSCCQPTGYGAASNAANVKNGDPVAIWGIGGVGLSVVRGAKLRGANPIIAVDLEGSREAMAKQFGATHFINSSKDDPVPIINELTGGGVKYAFEASGSMGAFVQATWSLKPFGKIIQTGVFDPDDRIEGDVAFRFFPTSCNGIQGVLYGMIDIHRDIPVFADMAINGELMLDKFITRRFQVEEINDVAEAMLKRQITGRWVCEWD